MNRRDWLKLISWAGIIPIIGPAGRISSALATSGPSLGKRLVLVELAGANDGLNTLVPFRHDQYLKLRPNLSLAQSERIELDAEYALHDGLKPLMKLWQKGQLAWVHGLGYPVPNRSHFKSTALWETGGDGNAERRSGWVTHDIEHKLGKHQVDPHGISLVDDMGIFTSDSGNWLSLSNPEQLRAAKHQSSPDINTDLPALSRVADQMQTLDASLSSLGEKLQHLPDVQRLPGGNLGGQLQQVLRFIRAEVDTPVFRVRLGGFDTHANQLGRHERLMNQLGNALAGFSRVLIQDGEWDNTLIMTYSEFGRRVVENRSGGTDHGTAAPHLLMGGTVQGGLYGKHPDLDALIDGDMQYTTDYRALYRQVLANWFGVGNNEFNAYRNDALNSLLRV
ncbi:MAG: DUF1501 domain-containing protein [Gammaproteobacteria bacterium]|nr:DUF1501 domain-containing protein [Gammaproteobacteria bacterium]